MEELKYEGEWLASYAETADAAKKALLELFEREPGRVFYHRQLAVLLEMRFYHWITGRALSGLANAGTIGHQVMPLHGDVPIHFFWHKQLRYWRREAKRVRDLVLEFSGTDFGYALGRHAEMMFDAALPRGGFLPTARNVRAYGGRAWDETEHDLDRVYERDGFAYGAEIKNTLDYMPRPEFELKLRMCRALRLHPLFIVRMAPKSYIEELRQAGGFTLVFKHQLYPYGQEPLAERVRAGLGLPVDVPVTIADGTVARFLNWHLKTHGLPETSR